MIYVEEKSIETSEEMKNSSTTHAQQNVTSSSEVTEEVVTTTRGENVPDIIMQTEDSQVTEADVSTMTQNTKIRTLGTSSEMLFMKYPQMIELMLISSFCFILVKKSFGYLVHLDTIRRCI